MKENRLGNIYGENKGTGFAGNIWDKKGVAPALTTMQGGGRQPMITVAMRYRTTDKLEQRKFRWNNEIQTIGKLWSHEAGKICNINGIAPTVKYNGSTVIMVLVYAKNK